MERFGTGARAAAGLFALTMLAACPDPSAFETPPTAPPVRPVVPAPESRITDPSPESIALSAHYQRVQNDLLNQGLLRGDGGGPDTPFTDSVLTRNFVRIALFDEYVEGAAGELRAEATVSRLRRWEQPISLSIEFGSSVPLAQRDRDTASIGTFANRLGRLTGVPIRQTGQTGNFHILVLNEGDREGYEPRLRSLVPGISDGSVRAFLNPPRDTFCLAIAFAEGGGSTYGQAIILIRGENPDLLRLACIHEEMAQAMGLANDSETARPSLFNDNNEFGRLTTHDELLLRMLYDDRLEPGMGVAQAAPIAKAIAAELVSGPS